MKISVWEHDTKMEMKYRYYESDSSELKGTNNILTYMILLHL